MEYFKTLKKLNFVGKALNHDVPNKVLNVPSNDEKLDWYYKKLMELIKLYGYTKAFDFVEEIYNIRVYTVSSKTFSIGKGLYRTEETILIVKDEQFKEYKVFSIEEVK